MLAAGLLERCPSVNGGAETLRVTDAGIAALARAPGRQQRTMSKHEALVERIARRLQREGRIVWTRLSARAAAGHDEDKTTWRIAMPDVFSVRHTTKEAMLEPMVHEIKVSRADLLSDLRNEAKRAAYLSLSSQAFYVLSAGIGDAHDVPEPFGVLVEEADGLRCLRFAEKRPCKMAFGTWMALAQATPLAAADDDSQSLL